MQRIVQMTWLSVFVTLFCKDMITPILQMKKPEAQGDSTTCQGYHLVNGRAGFWLVLKPNLFSTLHWSVGGGTGSVAPDLALSAPLKEVLSQSTLHKSRVCTPWSHSSGGTFHAVSRGSPFVGWLGRCWGYHLSGTTIPSRCWTWRTEQGKIIALQDRMI